MRCRDDSVYSVGCSALAHIWRVRDLVRARSLRIYVAADAVRFSSLFERSGARATCGDVVSKAGCVC